MKYINNYFFIWISLFYFLFSYFFFPYLSSIINTTDIFEINNQYVSVILFSLLIFLIIFFLIKKFFPIRYKAFEKTDAENYNILILAYILFVFGFVSKIQNVLRGNHENYIYSNINSKFFFIEYFFSMNLFTLLSIFFFINCFYNRKKNESINLFYFLLPLLYFILYILFSSGGRINLTQILFFILIYEVISYKEIKLFLVKTLFIFIIFFFLFSFVKINKDVTIMNQINVQVFDLNKKVYFNDLTTNDRRLTNVIFSKNFIFFLCKKNLNEYVDKGDYSYYKICKKSYVYNKVNNKKITTNPKINKSNKEKILALDNSFALNNSPSLNIFTFTIYNLSTRLNNYKPLYSLLNLLNDHKLNERSIIADIKNALFSYINKFLKFFDSKIIYERNLEIDNFNVISGIVSTSSEAGLSPTLIGEIFWIGGYYFLFFYFIKISLFIYLLNYVFMRSSIIYRVGSFFLCINYIASFEQSFEAHISIFFSNLLLVFSCIILSLFIRKLFFS